MTYCSKLVLAAILTLSMSGLVRADEKPAETPKPIAQAPKAENGTITDEQLGKMLGDIGYEVKPGKYPGGAQYFDVVVAGKGFDFPVRLGLSPNKRCVWLMSYLGDVPADATADQLRDILRAVNSKTGKMQLRMTGTQLKAEQPLDNVAVTAARLKRELDDFAAALADTADVWGFKKPAEKTAKTDAK